MIPLRDINPSRSRPVATYFLIATNILVFLYMASLPSVRELEAFVRTYGLTPAVVRGLISHPGGFPPFLTFFTSMFLHGGWVHLLGNMLYLWVFGDNVEDAMGHGRFLMFFALTGIVGGMAHVLTNPTSPVPVIGASGAIAGVLGGYLFLYPRARIISFIPLGFFFQLVEIPAIVYLPFWFLIQFASGLASFGVGTMSSVAWWAHIGGFLAGFVLVRSFARRRRF
ncbi:MAG: rhomboid family intramembrane serine protease [Armatimonadota bacterium]|nr:rhomboid family intramembrane serine protease [Armatimonadota bacterium]MDR5703688.1 rhomboid family intramembrane serine protease [Armatimonadota bacterium]MDR7433693.1 rhomboid family intramembrane serine protease [Armatimonadota bacterium]